ncbi:MAG: hypothetical protein ACFFBC_12920, partial [Promethearchaeota archaeon]
MENLKTRPIGKTKEKIDFYDLAEQIQDISVKNSKSGINELEKENHTVWLEKKSFRITLISTFTALAIVLGY